MVYSIQLDQISFLIDCVKNFIVCMALSVPSHATRFLFSNEVRAQTCSWHHTPVRLPYIDAEISLLVTRNDSV